MDKARPAFEDEAPVNVFDYWEGADFKLRMRRKDGYANYDDSVFVDPAPIAGTDEEILEIVKQQYKLSEFTDPSNFKSYDELKKKFEMVISDGSAMATAASMAQPEVARSTPPPQPAASAPAYTSPAATAPATGDDDDDVMSYFANLASED